MNARRKSLSFDLVDRESDWTIRLRTKKGDQIGVVLWFDGHADHWTVLHYRRVPIIREIPRPERQRLWARRWQELGREQFEGFVEARSGAFRVVESVINEGYEIADVASLYDLPAN